MRTGGAGLGELERRLEALEREYDLFLAGTRRAEPERERREVERALLKVVGSPLLSTAERFRAKTLAHRFRALESRVRTLLERKEAKARPRAPDGADSGGAEILVDRALLADPGALDRYVGRLHAELGRVSGGGAPVSREDLRERIRRAAAEHLGREGVKGIRFRLEVDGGRPKIRGDLVVDRRGDGAKGGG
ncbi:hypothetical protein [Deferrisoma sp.]